MPKTFPKKALGIQFPENPTLSYAARWEPEAASQTYVAGAPVVVTSGFITEGANPATSVLGFALEAGHNTATDGLALAKFVPAVDGLLFHANLLASSAADRALVATDLGTSYRIAKSATLLGTGKPGWYIEATGTTTACKILSFNPDLVVPNESSVRASVGDTNPRVGAIVLDSVRQWK